MRLGVALSLLAVAGCSFDPSGAPGDEPPPPPPPGELQLAIVFDNTNRSELVDVPVLVELTPDVFDYDVASADGSDLAFYDSDGISPVPYEIEHWEPGGTSLVWVLAPVIDSNSTTDRLVLTYGGDPVDPRSKDVWAAFKAVYHFAGDVATGPALDSSASGLDASVMGTVASGEGLAGRALKLDGNGYLELTPKNAFALELDEAETIELSMKAPVSSSSQSLIANEASCGGFAIGIPGADDYVLARFVGGTDCGNQDPVHLATWFGAQDDDAWHHVAFVIDRAAQQTELYIDGTRVDNEGANNTMPARGYTTTIGGDYAGGELFVGSIDEVRVSAGARAGDWVEAQNAMLRRTFVSYEKL